MTTRTIREIIGDRPVHGVAPDTPVRDVAKLMAENGVGAVVVLEGQALSGILTERDIVFRCVGKGRTVENTRAAEIMTADPQTVQVEDAISDALAAKLGDVFRHLPVMDGDMPVGVLSYREIPAEYVMMFEHFREMSTARADRDALSTVCE